MHCRCRVLCYFWVLKYNTAFTFWMNGSYSMNGCAVKIKSLPLVLMYLSLIGPWNHQPILRFLLRNDPIFVTLLMVDNNCVCRKPVRQICSDSSQYINISPVWLRGIAAFRNVYFLCNPYCPYKNFIYSLSTGALKVTIISEISKDAVVLILNVLINNLCFLTFCQHYPISLRFQFLFIPSSITWLLITWQLFSFKSLIFFLNIILARFQFYAWLMILCFINVDGRNAFCLTSYYHHQHHIKAAFSSVLFIPHFHDNFFVLYITRVVFEHTHVYKIQTKVWILN